MRRTSLWRLTTIATLALAAQGAAWGQAPLAAGQVPGGELQSWFDADGAALAGINVGNGCHFIARSNADGRRQTIYCPTLNEPFTVIGEGRVVGNQLCSKFGYPDGTRIDRCQDVFRVGENKYELRFEGRVMSVFYRLLR